MIAGTLKGFVSAVIATLLSEPLQALVVPGFQKQTLGWNWPTPSV
jgi:hypothetical protein